MKLCFCRKFRVSILQTGDSEGMEIRRHYLKVKPAIAIKEIIEKFNILHLVTQVDGRHKKTSKLKKAVEVTISRFSPVGHCCHCYQIQKRRVKILSFCSFQGKQWLYWRWLTFLLWSISQKLSELLTSNLEFLFTIKMETYCKRAGDSEIHFFAQLCPFFNVFSFWCNFYLLWTIWSRSGESCVMDSSCFSMPPKGDI